MANAVAIQVLQDGPRNAIVKVTGILDTSNMARQDLLVPADRSSIQPAFPGQFACSAFAIKAIDYVVDDGLDLRLWWDASSDVLIHTYNGRYGFDYTVYGNLQNNAGAGKTGKVQMDTLGYSSGTAEFSFVLQAIKQGAFA